MIKVLFIGDIISQVGCDYLRNNLPRIKREHDINIVIANGENSAVGNGILPHSANFLLDCGVDIITTGNHVFKRREIYDYLDENPQVIRPANFPSVCNGNGYFVYDGGKYSFCVINLMGVVFMEPLESPFVTVDRILKEVEADCYFVDFHAEATGEKKALGYYLDGRVSAVVGTHTHIQTADEQILPNGTAYITDVGMTGPFHSVLGVKPECVISRYKTNMPTRFEVENTECQFNAVVIEIDEKTGKSNKIYRLNIN